MAFAAAGFFFGSEIRRQQVESTQGQLDEAQDQVRVAWQQMSAGDRRAMEAEVKGRALTTAIRAETVGLRGTGEPLMRLDTEDALKTVEADLGLRETLANELFEPEGRSPLPSRGRFGPSCGGGAWPDRFRGTGWRSVSLRPGAG